MTPMMTQDERPRRSAFLVVSSVLAGAGMFAAYTATQSSSKSHGMSSLVNLFDSSSSTDSSETEPLPELRIRTEYELASGRKLAGSFGYTVAQVQKDNTISMSDGSSCVWSVNGVAQNSDGVPTSSFVYYFEDVTSYTVSCDNTDFTVHSKIVRRELRDLTEEDRGAYFAALVALYNIDLEDGLSKYGSTFQSANELLKIHLAGAADKECDHWHDDAGMINHHVGITWKFEQSLRMIEPTTASHYWDYTREYAADTQWYDSDIFKEDFFGTNSPSNNQHIVDNGHFAYLPVLTNAREFSSITNPYGMLRSPWNTNPVPYLMRHNYTAGLLGDGFSYFARCEDFAALVGSDLAEMSFWLNGKLHGPVHIMTGGHWDMNPKLIRTVMDSLLDAGTDMFLLLSKYLWRQGIARVPESCSSDASEEECKPSCPSEIIGDISAHQFIDRYGLSSVSDRIKSLVTLMKINDGMTDKEIIASLCEFGHPGEMFTSAAPQDPLFWPVHGVVERFIMLQRIWKEDSKVSFDETWGYYHVHGVPSDTHRICDWSGLEGLELPTCTAGTCAGHKATDVLPFTNLFGDGDTTQYTNVEFYEMIHPNNIDMPYVYENLDFWAGCKNEQHSFWKAYLDYNNNNTGTDDDIAVVDDTASSDVSASVLFKLNSFFKDFIW